MRIRDRVTVWKSVLLWGWWKVLGIIWGVVGAYDLVISQAGWHLPRLFEVTGGFDWKLWLVIGAIIAIVGTLEGSFRYTNNLRNKLENTISELQSSELKKWREQFKDRAVIPDFLFNQISRANELTDQYIKRKGTLKTPELTSISSEIANTTSYSRAMKAFKQGKLEELFGDTEFFEQAIIILQTFINSVRPDLSKSIQNDNQYSIMQAQLNKLETGLPKPIILKIHQTRMYGNALGYLKLINLNELIPLMSQVKWPVKDARLKFLEFQNNLTDILMNLKQSRLSEISVLLEEYFLGGKL